LPSWPAHCSRPCIVLLIFWLCRPELIIGCESVILSSPAQSKTRPIQSENEIFSKVTGTFNSALPPFNPFFAMLSDLRFAFRQLCKFPGHTVVVVLTLAFGIAVNTMIFGIVNTMFLQPLAVRDPSRLTVVVERSDDFSMPHGLSFLDFQDIRAGSKTLQNAIFYFFTPAHVSIPGQSPERAWVEAVSPDAFAQMAVTVALGRPLQASDGEMPPSVPVAVLTHHYWQNHYGSDPTVINRTVLINGHPFTIVGVAKPGFESFSWSLSVSMFVPSGTMPLLRTDGENFFKYRSAKAWLVLAHRAPGATEAEVNAELAVFSQRFGKDFPEEHRHSRLQAMPERWSRPSPSVSTLMPAMIALFTGLCVLVLCIACANVANLMGARALAREKELVVRSALGASRTRLIRQLLIESILLALLAGLVGFLLSRFGGDALSNSIPTGDVPIRRIPPDAWPQFVFTAGLSLLAGLVSGLMPALRSSRIDIVESLKQGSGQQAGVTRHRLRNLLVIGQVAISCLVLVCSALFLRGLHTAGSLNFGFRPERLIMLSLDLSLQGYDEARGLRFQEQILDKVRALPGVESAAFAQHVPFNYNITMRDVLPENPSTPLPDGHANVAFSAVSPGFVTMMGVPLQRGRDLAESDSAKSQRVAVINEAMAQVFWPGRDPIGQHFRIDWAGAEPIEVVGLTSTGKYVMLSEEPRPYFYLPQAQHYGMPATLLVRSQTDPALLAASLREIFHRLDPDLPIYSVASFTEHLNTSVFALMPLRTGATIAAIQGVLALGLAILGLYAVVSYGVTSRTREIGLRMALGATRGDVLRLISREAIRLTLTGMIIGLSFSILAGLGLSRVLFGVHAVEPVAYLGVVLVLTTVAALACWLPARRATKVDPMVALRAE
jgi:predicted permease